MSRIGLNKDNMKFLIIQEEALKPHMVLMQYNYHQWRAKLSTNDTKIFEIGTGRKDHDS